MVPGVNILLFAPEEKVHYSSLGNRCLHSAAYALKDLNHCLTSYYYTKVIVELEKTQTKNSTVLWCL